jgi:zinc/manganese transport system substrate-binding protein
MRVSLGWMVAAVATGLGIGVTGVVAQAPTIERPSIVTTTQVLGSVVRELVADQADVTVLMDAGADEHTWQPSARDSETLFGADLIVANGLDLEEGLVRLLAEAEASGVPVFRATDHVAVRQATDEGHETAADDEHADDEHAETDHEQGPADPHFWLDPLAMRDAVLALGSALDIAGVDATAATAAMAAELVALDAEIEALLAPIPPGDRRLVTGHGALGYFADRYGFDVVGTVIPGLSTSDEPSARDIADLLDAIRASGARVLVSDLTTPPSVAGAVAGEGGLRLVEVQVAQPPESGGYAELLRTLATSIAGALTS